MSSEHGPELGAWLHIPSGFSAEILAASGFDWCCVDRQHGLIGDSDMFDILRALHGSGVESTVRVSGVNPGEIGLALDAGATTIIVPNIESADEVQVATDACTFLPAGRRSFATTRTKLIGQRDVRCIAMIETAPALDALDEIAAVPGLAGLFVGPSDLRLALGRDDAYFWEAVELVGEACRRNELLAGAFVGDTDVASWTERGYSYLAVDSDSAILLAAGKDVLRRARDGAQDGRSGVGA